MNWMWMKIAMAYVTDPEPLFTMTARLRSILKIASLSKSLLECMRQTAIPAFVTTFVRNDFRDLDRVDVLANCSDSFIALTHRLTRTTSGAGAGATVDLPSRQQMVHDILEATRVHGKSMVGARCELGRRAYTVAMTWEYAAIKYGIPVPRDTHPRTLCNADSALDAAYEKWGSFAAMQRVVTESKCRADRNDRERTRRVELAYARLGLQSAPVASFVQPDVVQNAVRDEECVWSFRNIRSSVRKVGYLFERFVGAGAEDGGEEEEGGDWDEWGDVTGDGVGVGVGVVGLGGVVGMVDDSVDDVGDIGDISGTLFAPEDALLDRLKRAYDAVLHARLDRMHAVARAVRGHIHLLRSCMHACPCDFSSMTEEGDVLGSRNADLLNRTGGGLSIHAHVYVISGSPRALRRIEQYIARLTHTLTHIWPPPSNDPTLCNIPYEVPWAMNATISYLGASRDIGDLDESNDSVPRAQSKAALRAVAALYRDCVTMWLDYNQTVARGDEASVHHVGEVVFVQALRGYLLPPISATHVMRAALFIDNATMVAEVYHVSNSLIASCDISDHLGSVIADAGFAGCTRADAIQRTADKIRLILNA